MTDAIRDLTMDELKKVSGGLSQTISHAGTQGGGQSAGTAPAPAPTPVIQMIILGSNPTPMGGPDGYSLPYYAPMQS